MYSFFLLLTVSHAWFLQVRNLLFVWVDNGTFTWRIRNSFLNLWRGLTSGFIVNQLLNTPSQFFIFLWLLRPVVWEGSFYLVSASVLSRIVLKILSEKVSRKAGEGWPLALLHSIESIKRHSFFSLKLSKGRNFKVILLFYFWEAYVFVLNSQISDLLVESWENNNLSSLFTIDLFSVDELLVSLRASVVQRVKWLVYSFAQSYLLWVLRRNWVPRNMKTSKVFLSGERPNLRIHLLVHFILLIESSLVLLLAKKPALRRIGCLHSMQRALILLSRPLIIRV